MSFRVTSAVRELAKDAEKLGFKFDGYSGGTHPRFRHEKTGAVYYSSLTPSDHRTRRNALAEMQRIAGQKLPRPRSGKFKHHPRGPGLDTRLSDAERNAVQLVDELSAEADRIRERFDALISNPTRKGADEARRLMNSYEVLRRRLAGLHRVIPPLI